MEHSTSSKADRLAKHAQLVKKKKPFMEPDGSLSHSQEQAVGPYTEPQESNPHHPRCIPVIHFSIIFPYMPLSSEWSPPFGLSNQNTVPTSTSPTRYMPSPAHHPDTVW
jgi:hypothetical protein